MGKDMTQEKQPLDNHQKKSPEIKQQIKDLKRVRFISGLSAILGLLKILPFFDLILFAGEWTLLKNVFPITLALIDKIASKDLYPKSLLSTFYTDNWIGLLIRTFGAESTIVLFGADLISDAENVALPAPFDGFDIPAPFVDALITLYTHHKLKKINKKNIEILQFPNDISKTH